jgi:hypothetical protein
MPRTPISRERENFLRIVIWERLSGAMTWKVFLPRSILIDLLCMIRSSVWLFANLDHHAVGSKAADPLIIAIALKCMVRRRTAGGLKLIEGIVRVNVSGLFVGNYSPGT